jgi:hypothetical protein
MTGSGKTGLCLGLIEEAAIDGVPVLAIDPKGDLGNLLLTFPGLSPQEFQPWVDPDAARREGLTIEQYAAAQADLWRKGLAAWGQGPGRIGRLRSSASFSLFTPGSRAGLGISILDSFKAPPPSARGDVEVLAERASGAATSLLGLAGVEAPSRSREHTLLSTILADAWGAGTDLDLADVIRLVQTPSFDRLGVVDLESFFPASERFDLAMRLNGVLAAPDFAAWLEGEPLDPDTLLHTAEGHPRVSVFSIAHLGDAERMFFVSLLLNQLVGWMRRQTGTTGLRALLYIDEVLGYLPPVAAPPSKAPLLTILKQGRAFGLGVVLATQNPVDLDYKALSNTGTWFLGRLQTERDKDRLLDGLDAVAGGLDRADIDRLLSSLGKRVFLLHDVHETGPIVFETRWTLSYLRGPLSREQIGRLTQTGAPPRSTAESPPGAVQGRPARLHSPAEAIGDAGGRPLVPPGIQEVFFPAPGRTDVRYRPVVVGAARIEFSDRKLGIDHARDVVYVVPLTGEVLELDWADAVRTDIPLDRFERSAAPGSVSFSPLPAPAAQPRKYSAWQKAFARWVAQTETLDLLRHPSLGITSAPGEPERDFHIRLQHEARVARDEAVDAVRRKYASRQEALAERLRRAEAAVDREQQQASDQRLQTAVSMGATLLGSLLGRKVVSAGTLGRATTAARGVGRSMKEAADVKRAEDSVESVKAAIGRLDGQIAADASAVAARFDPGAPLERIVIRPKRGQVEVRLVALGWHPEEPAAR